MIETGHVRGKLVLNVADDWKEYMKCHPHDNAKPASPPEG